MSIHSIDSRRPLRDIVVVGGSAGGFQSLRTMLSGLPADCQAAFFVVLHVPDDRPSRAAELLQKHCALSVRFAEDDQPIENGTVSIAPCDTHLLLGARHAHLRRGPRENGFRPAIDPLFRSAVAHQGGRAIGVVLSGLGDDGASGSRALARIGADVFVEDPEVAEFPSMPQAALRLVEQAHRVAIDRLAAALLETIGSPGRDDVEVPEDIRLELMVSTLEKAWMSTEDKLGTLKPYNCPDCNGVLWEIRDGALTRYRCHTGHAFTSDVLANLQEQAIEKAMYETLRAQRGRAHMLREMAARTLDEQERAQLERRAQSYDEDSTTIESLLLNRVEPGDIQRIVKG